MGQMPDVSWAQKPYGLWLVVILTNGVNNVFLQYQKNAIISCHWLVVINPNSDKLGANDNQAFRTVAALDDDSVNTVLPNKESSVCSPAMAQQFTSVIAYALA
jgi:hypothetical protein